MELAEKMVAEPTKRKRRGHVPFQEKLADIDARIAAAEKRFADLKAARAKMIDERRTEAQAVLNALPK